jgi:hypothetical protein
MTLADKWNEDEFEINSGSSDQKTEDNIDKLDDFNPADMVYDIGGIQIYKNDDATIMLKIIGQNPLKFIALYVETTKLTIDESINELEKATGNENETTQTETMQMNSNKNTNNNGGN